MRLALCLVVAMCAAAAARPSAAEQQPARGGGAAASVGSRRLARRGLLATAPQTPNVTRSDLPLGEIVLPPGFSIEVRPAPRGTQATLPGLQLLTCPRHARCQVYAPNMSVPVRFLAVGNQGKRSPMVTYVSAMQSYVSGPRALLQAAPARQPIRPRPAPAARHPPACPRARRR